METIKEVATKEGIFRASQHNFNQAEAGYNAKWFKRGALFGAKWQQERSYSEEEVIELLDNFRNSHEIDLIKWFNLNKK